MSRTGKKPITIPDKTSVSVEGRVVKVTGPLGKLSRAIHPSIEISSTQGIVSVSPKNNTGLGKALWGTYASHVTNMIEGVNKPFVKKLELQGIGYRVALSGNSLDFMVGFSHPVKVLIPKGLTVSVEKSIITISGSDKELVGQFAANVRAVKKPEPYKGKGIRYQGEVIKQKQGKKSVA